MSSSVRGKPLTPEVKKVIVSVKHYFDRDDRKGARLSAQRTANAVGIGIATVKRIMAEYNRDPHRLDRAPSLRGRRGFAVSASHQERVRQYVREANRRGSYITLETIRKFLQENQPEESFHLATLARTLDRWGFEFGKGTRSQHLKEKDHVIAARRRYLRIKRDNRLSGKNLATVRPDADSVHFGHRFRFISDTDSDSIRTVVPIEIGQLDRSVSDARYFLILV